MRKEILKNKVTRRKEKVNKKENKALFHCNII